MSQTGTFHGVRVAPNGLPERNADGNPILEGEVTIQITRKEPGRWCFRSLHRITDRPMVASSLFPTTSATSTATSRRCPGRSHGWSPE